MVNRHGCGQPDGYPWKRIDYGWSKDLAPIGIERFGIVPAGEAAPSDHFGIVVEYPRLHEKVRNLDRATPTIAQ